MADLRDSVKREVGISLRDSDKKGKLKRDEVEQIIYLLDNVDKTLGRIRKLTAQLNTES